MNDGMRGTKSLHTLNARGNIMLEVMRDHFELTPVHMFREIQGMRRAIENTLAAKNIDYDKLKSALVPAQDRREIALVFDTMSIEDSWYGADVMKYVIPLFERKSNHSVLVGDYLDRRGQSERLFQAFRETVDPRRPIEYRHPTQFFIVYINNLTEAMVERFDQGLRSYAGYAGIADMTYASPFKVYLSTMLVNSFIKHGGVIIQGHEPDRDASEDVNMSGYPFEENGYTCRSVPGDLMDLLLSYKIERPVYPGFEVDTEFSLNAVSVTPIALDDFDVEVAEAKLDYLKSQKSGSIARAGLEAITTEMFSALIRAKIKASYIYNLAVLEEHNVTKFNIIVELPGTTERPPTRLLAALSYEPERKILRLLTLF